MLKTLRGKLHTYGPDRSISVQSCSYQRLLLAQLNGSWNSFIEIWQLVMFSCLGKEKQSNYPKPIRSDIEGPGDDQRQEHIAKYMQAGAHVVISILGSVYS